MALNALFDSISIFLSRLPEGRGLVRALNDNSEKKSAKGNDVSKSFQLHLHVSPVE